jgi:hypothetical protein
LTFALVAFWETAKAVCAKSRLSFFGWVFDLRLDLGISNIATNRKRREINFQTDPLPLTAVAATAFDQMIDSNFSRPYSFPQSCWMQAI